jgi:hypothetical protein
MRSCLGFVIATIAACSSSPGTYGTGPGGPNPPDSGIAVSAPAFEIASPSIDVQPNTQVTFCYFFHTSNTDELHIKKWASKLGPGVAQMVLFLTQSDLQTPGTLTTDQCGINSMSPGPNGPIWTYSAESAESADASMTLPDDDGTGTHTAVAQTVVAGQSGFLQLQLANTTQQVIHATATLDATAYVDGTQVTMAAPFLINNPVISLPSAPSPNMPTTDTVTGSCPVDPTAKFYFLSTQTFNLGTRAFIKDGSSDQMLVDTTNWANPDHKEAPPVLSFSSGQMAYGCNFSNPTSRTVESGDGPATGEMCAVYGFYFPATQSIGHQCLISSMLY